MRRTTSWGAVAHVFVAIALALPAVLAGVAIGAALLNPDQSMLNQGLLVLLGAGFALAVVWVALLPEVRPVEVATARTLLGLDLPDVSTPEGWASRRRGALWLGVLAAIGLVVAVGLLYLLPMGIGLVGYPFSGAEELSLAGDMGVLRTGAGWSAVWLVVPGLIMLAASGGLVWGAAGLITRWAPRVIGPTLAERVVVAAERERDLARVNTLARELHDSLGHRLTAMTVQATAARRLLATDPGAADRAMAAVEDLGRRAQADVDSVVGSLRGRADAGRQPTTGRSDLVALVRPLLDQQALDLHVEAPVRLELPGGSAHTAYRVVQEGLTNATRHGAGRADLRLAADDGQVVIELANPVAPAPATQTPAAQKPATQTPATQTPATPAPGDRAGLRGLRERVLLEGGTLSAQPEEESGRWLLRVTLPTG